MTLAIRRLLLAAALAFGLAALGIALAGSAASPFGLTGVAFAQEGDDDDGGDDDNGGDDDDGGRGDDDNGRPQGGVDTGAGGTAGADGSGSGSSMLPLAATGLAATVIGGGLLARRRFATER